MSEVGKGKRSIEWTQQEIEVVKEMWVKGFHAQQIATVLNEMAGDPNRRGRNSVIGKANRLGFGKHSEKELSRNVTAKPKEREVVVEGKWKGCQYMRGNPSGKGKFCGCERFGKWAYCLKHLLMCVRVIKTKNMKEITS